MPKNIHEIRDPIHVFVRLDSDERKVLNSRPFQRLRHIHQLALTYLVYPGATHKRFEHSLGVMEVADRVFRVVTDPGHATDSTRSVLPPSDQLRYWRRVLRMAARLIDTIRILPTRSPGEHEEPVEPALGVEEGGIQSAEALMLARYFMYSQVYFHPVRRIYDSAVAHPISQCGCATTGLSRPLWSPGHWTKLPAVSVDYVFADRSLREQAGEWLADRREEIVRLAEEEGAENG